MNDRDLDNLFRDALQGDAPAEQLQRLERFWRNQLAADRRHRRTFAVALVASLALVATGATWLLSRPDEVPFERHARTAAPPEVDSAPAPGNDAHQLAISDRTVAKPSASRPATPYEHAMLRLSAAQAAEAQLAVVELNPEAIVQRLEERLGLTGLASAAEATPHSALRVTILRRLLEVNDEIALRGYLSLVANENTRFAALSAVDQLQHPPVEAFLVLLRDQEKSVRTSAAIALGHINGPKVTASLINLVTQDRAAPAEAWIALLACRDESAEQFIADAAHHPRMIGRLNNARIFWQTIQ
jgi:hypothetical protein